MVETFTELLELIKRQPLDEKEKFYLAWYEYDKGNLPWRFVMSLCPYNNTAECPLVNPKKYRCRWGYHILKRCRILTERYRQPRKIRGWYRGK